MVARHGRAPFRQGSGKHRAKNEYYWKGTWNKDSAVTIVWRTGQHNDSKWVYTEQQWKYGHLTEKFHSSESMMEFPSRLLFVPPPLPGCGCCGEAPCAREPTFFG